MALLTADAPYRASYSPNLGFFLKFVLASGGRDETQAITIAASNTSGHSCLTIFLNFSDMSSDFKMRLKSHAENLTKA